MLKGFISYAHEDGDLCDMFRKQLNMLKLSRIATFWADHGIEPGDPWKDVILDQLNRAEVALFLISPDMFWSEFIKKVEWPLARRRMNAGKLLVIPVILRETTLWERAFNGELGRRHAVPRGAKAIAESPSRDAAFAEAARMIADRIEKGAPRA
jgi:TIR domain-containing protein